MKAIVLAYHNIGCVGIRALLDHGYEIQAVFTHEDDHNENIWFESVAELAAVNNIPVFAPENINHPIWVEKIRQMQPDILFSFYYRKMVSKNILDIPHAGCLNLHGSYLPRYRGRCPVNWVLINGETETGVTLHYMTAKPDDGDIAGQKKIPIEDTDTALSLHAKLASAAKALLNEKLPGILRNDVERKAQQTSEASYFGGRRPEDGEISWHGSATTIRNLVRAVTRPYPGAYSFLGNRKCFFWQVAIAENPMDAAPGTIIDTSPLTIACGEGAVVVQFGQPENGVFMNGTQLANTLNLTFGMRFNGRTETILDKRPKKTSPHPRGEWLHRQPSERPPSGQWPLRSSWHGFV